ncbi:MAG: hypothetical protein ACI9YL_001371 [Luteibaculaceae bacterium]|jgi:hypothetical protein
MKKATIIIRPFLILALFLSASFTYSQSKPFPTIEDGPKWMFELDTIPDFGISLIYEAVRILGEEEICGKDYFVVKNGSYQCIDKYNYDTTMYYRVEGEKVFLRFTHECGDPELLMYDFGWDIGDSISLPINRCGRSYKKFVVVEKRDTVVMGISREAIGIFLQGNNPGAQITYIIKGLGFPHLPFYPMGCFNAELSLYCYNEYVFCLCSTQKGQYTFKGTYKPYHCDSLFVNINSPKSFIPGASAYFHAGELNFKGFPSGVMVDSKWQLFNLQSGLVATGSQLSKTPLDLEAGVYLVFVKNKEGAVLLQQKMVVQ